MPCDFHRHFFASTINAYVFGLLCVGLALCCFGSMFCCLCFSFIKILLGLLNNIAKNVYIDKSNSQRNFGHLVRVVFVVSENGWKLEFNVKL